MINQNYATMASLRLYEAESSIESVARENRVDPASIIDFSLNVNPFGPPHSAVITAKAALDRCNSYPDLNFGELRGKLAARHEVLEESLFFGAGLDDVIKLLIHAWTTEGDAVLIHLPTFPRYELEAGIRGCRVLAVKSDPPNLIDVRRCVPRSGRSLSHWHFFARLTIQPAHKSRWLTSMKCLPRENGAMSWS
jgi:histidinol-phosphate/aromatic aminotransferase/cobyric acid decarboxylase-like protein